MKTKTRNLLRKHTRDMIRWQLRMRDRFLTCNGTVEIFRDLASALQRHAAIVNELRSSGWSIASYTQ